VLRSLLPLVLLLFAVVAFLTMQRERSLIEAEFLKRGRDMAANLARDAELGVLAGDRSLLDAAMRPALGDPELRRVAVYGSGGEPLAWGGPAVVAWEADVRGLPSTRGGRPLPNAEAAPLPREDRARLLDQRQPLSRPRAAAMEFLAPVLSEEARSSEVEILDPGGPHDPEQKSPTVVGFVELALSLDPLRAHVLDLAQLWAAATFAFLAVATLAVYGFSRRITQPINRLTAYAKRIAAGSLRETIPVDSRDEIGQLATAFNEMGRALAEQITTKETLLAEIQKANQVLEARSDELAEKSRLLEVANRHKSEFLANMSHELRTPLNAIIGFSEVMLEGVFGPLTPKQAEYLRDIFNSGHHLLSLINDILDLSKIEAGRMELELGEFDLPTALGNTVMVMRERAKRGGLQLSVDVDPKLGVITADERKVKQVLLNLLSNAIKFTPEGGSVKVEARMRNDAVEVGVTDTGIGIPERDRSIIFEEFRQVRRDPSRAREGTGLGLTLARRFVELHGGRLWLDSKVDHGSTFTFSLPLR
jgi:signal transduction histidine kinase